jgi:hypothetical protein
MDGIVRKTKELFDCEPALNFEQKPQILFGDKLRVKYIVLCLIQKVIEKNKRKQLVKISVSVSEDDQVNLSMDSPFEYHGRGSRGNSSLHGMLTIRVIDCGEALRLTRFDIS